MLSKNNDNIILFFSLKGVAHTDDLNYLFPCLNRMYADLQLHNTGNDWTMVNIMTELWSGFVKDGYIEHSYCLL